MRRGSFGYCLFCMSEFRGSDSSSSVPVSRSCSAEEARQIIYSDPPMIDQVIRVEIEGILAHCDPTIRLNICRIKDTDACPFSK